MKNQAALEKIALDRRRTKIVATLGPATGNNTQIEALLKAGVNVIRLNMSHGDENTHRLYVERIRRISKRLRKHTAIIMDLCGPKIRVGKFTNGYIELIQGQNITITSRKVSGDENLIHSQYKNLHKDVKKGNRILLDDGRLEFVVTSIIGKDVRCKVVHAGILRNNKGMNLPDSNVTAPSLTAKDKNDALLAIELGADFLALSFVRHKKDVTALSNFLKKNDASIPIISKIEKPEAIENIEEIIKHSYGIMIARGDLGIELPAERVPLIQRDLIKLARKHNCPVIVATQMLESMVNNSRPTRAEVGDVANAALLSADAVMLSEETAAGKYPVESVQNMDRVLREIERYQWTQGGFIKHESGHRSSDILPFRQAISHAILTLADDLNLQAIIIPTRSGTTARVIAADRPSAPTIGVCARPDICRRMMLHWGVISIQVDEADTHDWMQLCKKISQKSNLAKPGHTVLLASGFSDISSQSAPVLKIMHL